MGVLRRAFGFELLRGGGNVIRAVAFGDEFPRFGLRLVCHAHRIRPHVRNQADAALCADFNALVQVLRDRHGAAVAETEFAGCLLLQGAGDEGSGRIALLFALFYVGDAVIRAVEVGEDGVHIFLRFGFEPGSAARKEFGGKQELLFGGDGRQQGGERPVLFGNERKDFTFAFADHSHGDGLDAACRQALLYLLRQHGRELVADKTVEDAPCLLCIHAVNIYRTGLRDGLLHSLLRNFVELNALGVFEIQSLGKMPCNRFAFAVGIGGKEDTGRAPRRTGQFFEDIFAVGDGLIGWGEIVFDIYAEFAFGQVADVAHAGLDDVIAAEKVFKSLGFGRGLHDDECFRHAG